MVTFSIGVNFFLHDQYKTENHFTIKSKVGVVYVFYEVFTSSMGIEVNSCVLNYQYVL